MKTVELTTEELAVLVKFIDREINDLSVTQRKEKEMFLEVLKNVGMGTSFENSIYDKSVLDVLTEQMRLLRKLKFKLVENPQPMEEVPA